MEVRPGGKKRSKTVKKGSKSAGLGYVGELKKGRKWVKIGSKRETKTVKKERKTIKKGSEKCKKVKTSSQTKTSKSG